MEGSAGVVRYCAGRPSVGKPRIVTLDLDIELEFTKRDSDGTLQGKLVSGTNFGKIDSSLREVGPPPFPPPPGRQHRS